MTNERGHIRRELRAGHRPRRDVSNENKHTLVSDLAENIVMSIICDVGISKYRNRILPPPRGLYFHRRLFIYLFVCRQEVGAHFCYELPGNVQMDCKSGSMKKKSCVQML